VKDLAVRLSALDADAAAALQVIAYFDSPVESRTCWAGNVREPQGRLRLQLALALRRLHRHP
jgi:hypothetical protein